MINVFKPKRRDVLRTATGLAAAAVVGGSLANGQEVVAQRQSRGQSGITANFEDVGEFNVLSFSWGFSNPVSQGGGIGTGSAKSADFVIVKLVDASSASLQRVVATGQRLQGAVITGMAIDAGAGGTTPYLYKLENVRVTSYSISGSSNDGLPTESVTFVFEKVSFAFEVTEFTWNFQTNTPG